MFRITNVPVHRYNIGVRHAIQLKCNNLYELNIRYKRKVVVFALKILNDILHYGLLLSTLSIAKTNTFSPNIFF